MKLYKLICAILCAALVFTLAGCGGKTEPASTPDVSSSAQGGSETDPSASSGEGSASGEGADALVVYFSRTGEQYRVGVIDKGNTAIVAEIIAAELGADLYEITPADDRYPTTYDELADYAKQEQRDGARPAYVKNVPDLSRYDTVFIGAPVWWGDWPMIMYSFFEGEDLSGKTLVPFSTHEGSGLSGFDRKLASAVPGAQVLEGLAIRGQDCRNAQDDVKSSVREWLDGLGY